MAKKEFPHTLLDIRTVKRSINNGLLTSKDYDSHLKSLPDLASKSTTCETELPATSSRKAKQE